MLFLDTLRNKPQVKVNDEYIKDLTAQSVDFNTGGRMIIKSTGIVSSDLVMRSDLIAKIYFRDSNKLDYLLKFNGISNPFSIDEGDIILIPDDDVMKAVFKPKRELDKVASKESLINKFFDPDRLSKKDAKRLEYLQVKSEALSNGSKTNLPPNFAEPGSKEIKVVDGNVIFGADVVKCNVNTTDPISKARAKSKLIENRIFRSVK